MKNYVQKIRAKIGKEKFILPAARIIVENEHNEILVVEKNNNGKIGLPAGGIEEGETIEDCIKREVLEETGIQLLQLEVIGISTDPDKETITYPNGDIVQSFTVEFYSNQWTGEIQVQDTAEIKRARFADTSVIHQLPINELSAFESLAYYRKYQRIMLK